jgi:hypothetical protein
VATSGSTFLRGSAWGEWQGALAVGLLKGQGIYLMRFNPSPTTTRVASVTRMAVAQGFGRIRAVQLGPDGALYFTTSNGSNDRIVRIRPTATVPRRAAGTLISPVGVTAARTGSQVLTFVRSTGNGVWFKRSGNDGATWSPWTSAGATSTDAPSATSSRAGRIDLFTRNGSRQLVHTWFQNGVRQGQRTLGGTVIAQHASSLGNGTIDVFALATTGSAWRKHFDGTRWSAWISAGGAFTSGLSASAHPAGWGILVTGRGTNGRTYERTFYPSTATSGWVMRTDNLAAWSDRALGDRWPGRALVAVGNGVDKHAVVQRGGVLIGTRQVYTSAPDVVTRPDGTFLLFGKGSDGHLQVYDGRPGSFRTTSLGGNLL